MAAVADPTMAAINVGSHTHKMTSSSRENNKEMSPMVRIKGGFPSGTCPTKKVRLKREKMLGEFGEGDPLVDQKTKAGREGEEAGEESSRRQGRPGSEQDVVSGISGETRENHPEKLGYTNASDLEVVVADTVVTPMYEILQGDAAPMTVNCEGQGK